MASSNRFLSAFTTLVAFVAMLILSGLLSDKYFTYGNITNVMRQAAPLGIVSLGVLFVILTGGIDLSLGAIMAIGNVALALTLDDYGVLSGVLFCIAVCAAVGAVSGFLITKGNITPFITTLAVATILRGFALILTKGNPIFIENEAFIDFGSEDWFLVPKPFVLLLLFFLLSWVLLRYSIFGRLAVAIGSNEMAARYAALRVDLYKALTYVFCGLSCGIAATVVTSRTGVGSALIAEGYELDAIASVVIGGGSLMGGRGTTFNTLLGALTISMISNIMNLMNVPGYHQKVVKGFIILFAVLAESLKNRKAT